MILSRAEIKPHLTEYGSERLSQSEFEERCGEVCGLYVDRRHVLVVSIDEKTGIQAKAPTKPTPARRSAGAARARVHAQRTQCLFAALKVHHGDVLAMPQDPQP